MEKDKSTHWPFFFATGAVLLLLYTPFFIGGLLHNTQPPPATLAASVLMARTTPPLVMSMLVRTLSVAATATHGNTTLKAHQKARALSPLLGTALPALLGLNSSALGAALLQITANATTAAHLERLYRGVLLGDGARTDELVVAHIIRVALRRVDQAQKQGEEVVVRVLGTAVAGAIGRENVAAAVSALLNPSARPTLGPVLYSLGPALIAELILLVHGVAIITHEQHFDVRRRGSYFIMQTFVAAAAILPAAPLYAYLQHRAAPLASLFVVYAGLALATALLLFAPVQQLDLVQRAHSPDAAHTLRPASYFRLSALAIACWAACIVPALAWVCGPLHTSLPPAYLAVGLQGVVLVSAGLVAVLALRVRRLQGDYAVPVLCRHAGMQVGVLTTCLGGVALAPALQAQAFVVLTYAWAFVISWYVVDLFGPPLWRLGRPPPRPSQPSATGIFANDSPRV